ncbi:MAG: hypothetical protein NTV40_00775 [Solirubrobacterales bacterium]|nr:hypothetical protein [Solirubrobacterales bacterium]
MIAEPPLLEGADQDTVTEASRATPETLLGAVGTAVAGVPDETYSTTHRDFLAFVFDSNLS